MAQYFEMVADFQLTNVASCSVQCLQDYHMRSTDKYRYSRTLHIERTVWDVCYVYCT